MVEVRCVPLALPIDVELKDTMAIRHTEGHLVFARPASDGRQRGPNVRVEHSELELHVVYVGVRAPQAELGVVLGDERGESLHRR